MGSELNERTLSRAYRAGIFPMAESVESGDLSWYDPDPRGILPLARFHLPRRLLRTVRSGSYRVTADTAFARVIAECAVPTPDRPGSWINNEIARLFVSLHRSSVEGARAHSIECWLDGDGSDNRSRDGSGDRGGDQGGDQGGDMGGEGGDPAAPRLVGGLYGLAIGRAFFGESMFSRARDASKVALVHLVARLRLSGYVLLDTQFITTHLSQFGATEVSRHVYQRLLAEALRGEVDWIADPSPDMLAGAIAALAASDGGQ